MNERASPDDTAGSPSLDKMARKVLWITYHLNWNLTDKRSHEVLGEIQVEVSAGDMPGICKSPVCCEAGGEVWLEASAV